MLRIFVGGPAEESPKVPAFVGTPGEMVQLSHTYELFHMAATAASGGGRPRPARTHLEASRILDDHVSTGEAGGAHMCVSVPVWSL